MGMEWDGRPRKALAHPAALSDRRSCSTPPYARRSFSTAGTAALGQKALRQFPAKSQRTGRCDMTEGRADGKEQHHRDP
jgi:hypothetical protein